MLNKWAFGMSKIDQDQGSEEVGKPGTSAEKLLTMKRPSQLAPPNASKPVPVSGKSSSLSEIHAADSAMSVDHWCQAGSEFGFMERGLYSACRSYFTIIRRSQFF